MTAPWWSLGVEEQFYLIWPFLILLPPRSWIKWLVGGAIVSGTAWHIVMEWLGRDGFAAYFLLPASLDALGGGAALALAWGSGSLRYLYLAGLVLLVPLGVLAWAGSYGWEMEALSTIAMVALVAGGAQGISGWIGAALQWRPLRLLGRISYGVYLYHLAVLAVSAHFVASLGDRGPRTFAICAVATIALATLSWIVVERPMNRLKRHFPLQ